MFKFFFSFLWKTVLFVALSFAMFNFLLMSATHNFYKTQRAKKQHKTDRGDNKSDMHRQCFTGSFWEDIQHKDYIHLDFHNKDVCAVMHTF